MAGASHPVSGRYRLGELLGSGGSASVFAALDTVTGSDVALKVLHPHLSERSAAREAFFAEARKAVRLRHPNIVGVLGVGVDDSADAPVAWIALERATGSSLAERVGRHGPLSPGEAVAVGDGILRALEAAHAIGLIHRDVSPANVMVAPGGITVEGVRLLDFGLADAAGATAVGTDDLLGLEATGRTGVLGNVNYISPEQVRGEPIDERGDLYQVGGLLHFALTGTPPFPRATTGQTMRAHLETPPPVPSVSDARIPRALDRIVVRAMLKAPGDRFASAAQMRTAVVEAVAVDAVPAAVAPPTPRSPAPTEDLGVTRVLGRTMVTPRAQSAPPASSIVWGTTARLPARAGSWFVGITAAIVVAMFITFAATSAPTASVEPSPTATPSAAPPPAAPVEPAVEPEPAVVEPVLTELTVPDLGRHTLAEATRALADAGLRVGTVTSVDSALLRDVVLESQPAGGSRVAAGEAVAVVVASGFNTIPDAAGPSLDAAVATIQAAGFAPTIDARYVGTPSQAGHSLGTDPGAGARMTVGSPVSVLEAVYNGPTATPTQTPPAPTPVQTGVPDAEG